MRVRRLIPFATACLLALAGGLARAGEPRWPPEDPEPYRSLVEAARRYFDLDEELWLTREALFDELDAHAQAGTFSLGDTEGLRWLVYQARNFEPDMTDRKWQRSQDINEAKSLAGTLYWIKSENLTITFSVPRKYPKLEKLRTRFPRIAPYPLLLTMHERQDYTGQRFPGEVLAKRRFPKETWEELYERWIILIPEAAAGNFLQAGGQVRSKVFTQPYSVFWKHYHIDFERVILDGGEQALAVATSMPVFFAGIVLRGDWTLETREPREAVRNFAPVPVYVVDNPALAEQLTEAGHTDVSLGPAGPGLLRWMEARRRVPPKAFEWVAQRHDQVLPYWVNLDSLDWDAPARTVRVAVVDTPENPNTICVAATGIDDLSLFLDDDTVDLDRPVRVLVNGHLEHDWSLEPEDERMRALGRDLDLLFNREPVPVRRSMFFGWLKPARIVRLPVRPPDGEVTCPAPPAAAPEPPPETVEPIEIPDDEPATPPVPSVPPDEPESGGSTVLLLALLLLVLLLTVAVVRILRRR